MNNNFCVDIRETIAWRLGVCCLRNPLFHVSTSSSPLDSKRNWPGRRGWAGNWRKPRGDFIETFQIAYSVAKNISISAIFGIDICYRRTRKTFVKNVQNQDNVKESEKELLEFAHCQWLEQANGNGTSCRKSFTSECLQKQTGMLPSNQLQVSGKYSQNNDSTIDVHSTLFWLWTLTYDLDHQTPPRGYAETVNAGNICQVKKFAEIDMFFPIEWIMNVSTVWRPLS